VKDAEHLAKDEARALGRSARPCRDKVPSSSSVALIQARPPWPEPLALRPRLFCFLTIRLAGLTDLAAAAFGLILIKTLRVMHGADVFLGPPTIWTPVCHFATGSPYYRIAARC